MDNGKNRYSMLPIDEIKRIIEESLPKDLEMVHHFSMPCPVLPPEYEGISIHKKSRFFSRGPDGWNILNDIFGPFYDEVIRIAQGYVGIGYGEYPFSVKEDNPKYHAISATIRNNLEEVRKRKLAKDTMIHV